MKSEDVDSGRQPAIRETRTAPQPGEAPGQTPPAPVLSEGSLSAFALALSRVMNQSASARSQATTVGDGATYASPRGGVTSPRPLEPTVRNPATWSEAVDARTVWTGLGELLSATRSSTSGSDAGEKSGPLPALDLISGGIAAATAQALPASGVARSDGQTGVSEDKFRLQDLGSEAADSPGMSGTVGLTGDPRRWLDTQSLAAEADVQPGGSMAGLIGDVTLPSVEL
jgi:hypothetical protein